jgi:hypothetical protein
MGTKQYDSATDLITFSRASGGTALSKISYGNELVTNGTFDTNASGWLGNNSYYSPTIESQRLKVVTVASGQWNYAHTSVSGLTIGKMYRFQASSFVGTATRHRISLGTSSGNSVDIFSQGLGYNVNQTVDMTFTATTTVVYVSLQNTDGVTGSTTFFDNISIKEVLFDQADGTLQVFNHGNNVPRIEYDATGAVKGLLIEEARTNAISTSEVAPTTYSFGITKAVDSSVVSPSGGNNVEKFTLSSANEQHLFGNHNGICTGSGTSTYSIFAKGSGHNLIRLRMANTVGKFSCDFNLSTGQKQVTSVSDSSVTGAIESMGNGWWRCSMTYAAEKTNPYASVFLINAMDAPLSNSFLGDGASGVYVWGSQYEAGAFPTSYIPTTGAAATRVRDLAEIPTSAFGYNNDQGSLVVDVLTPVADQFMALAYFNTSTFLNSRGLSKANTGNASSGNNYINSSFHDGVSIKIHLGQQTQAEYTKLGLSYGDTAKAVRDGGTVISGANPSPNPTRLHLGGRENGLQSQCWIKSIQYYPRQLTDTQLQELTT